MRRMTTAAPALAVVLVLVACSTDEAQDPAPSSEPVSLALEVVTDALDVPREVLDLGDGTLLVSDQAGLVVVLDDGEPRAEPFLDVTERILPPTRDRLELGLAGVELAPDFAESGVVYTFTTEPGTGSDRVDRITRWVADPESLVVDPASATVLLEHEVDGWDHVGGELELDGEGVLYAGFGVGHDTGAAQDTWSLEGSIIRIDPEDDAQGDAPYAIPDDNPFVDGGGLPEIYAYGYRNPWRLDWDDGLGLVVAEAMWVDKAQQVSIPQPGDDAGYPLVGRATDACWVDGALHEGCETTPDGTPIAPPVLEYGQDVGRIASGAAVLDGQLPGLDGVLVSDWEGALLLASPGEAPWPWERLDDLDDLTTSTLWDLQATSDAVYAMTTSSSMTGGTLFRVVVA